VAVSQPVVAVTKAVAVTVAVETVAVSQTMAKWHLRHVQIVYILLFTDKSRSQINLGGKCNVVTLVTVSLLINLKFMAAVRHNVASRQTCKARS
jgi:hypothetical protein